MNDELLNLHDYEKAAQKTLSREVWDWVAGGAMDEQTLGRNRSAFASLTLRPRYLRDVSVRELTANVLGTEISMPIMLAPAGFHRAAHADAELATAGAAERSQTLFMVPMMASHSLEQVAAASRGPLWFQIYHWSRRLTESLARAAEANGYKALCITVDAPLASPKERDRRNKYAGPHEGIGLANMPADDLPSGGSLLARPRPPFTWADLEWLKAVTSLPIVVKGLNTAEDAHLVAQHGADGIIVSTHGGRLLDGTLSSIESLGGVVEAVGDRVEVYLDSGVRRGTDVLKALALGARAVAIGRPLYWGLAAGGAEGLHDLLEILRAELDLALGYCGRRSVSGLGSDLVNVPRGWGTNASGAAL